MKRELVESYFDWNEIRLEAYLRIDPELIELERECEETMDELEPYIEQYGHEFWTLIDRIVSARHVQIVKVVNHKGVIYHDDGQYSKII